MLSWVSTKGETLCPVSVLLCIWKSESYYISHPLRYILRLFNRI